MTAPPLAAVGLDPATPTSSVGGSTGRLWRVDTAEGPYALRLTPQPGELAAMAAARSAGLPVPEVLNQASTDDGTALLLTWLSGIPVAEAIRRNPASAAALGETVGAAQRRLHDVPAPAGVPRPNRWMTPPDAPPPPAGEQLLHLDWHWLNILVDGTKITAILDWENARRGPAVLDLARTHALLTVEPSLAALSATEREVTQRFAAAWAAGYGPAATAIPPWAHHWAGRTMLADRGPSFADRPAALDGLRAWTAAWRRD